jgi:hypothetical protein
MDYPANEASKTRKKLPISLAGQTLTGASFAKTGLFGVTFIGMDESPTRPDYPVNHPSHSKQPTNPFPKMIYFGVS